jgi:hypothetical protein
MRKSLIGLVLALSLSTLPAFSANTPKAGSACIKKGVTKTYKGKEFKCVKKRGKLVWSKGKVVNKETSVAAPEVTASVAPSPTPTTTPTSTPTPNPSLTPTTTPTVSSSIDSLIQSPKVASADACRMLDRRSGATYQKNNVAFPLSKDLIPATGQTEFTFIPIDFVDAPGSKEELEDIKRQVEALVNWYDYFSDGRLSIKTNQITTWYRAPKRSLDYALATPSVSSDGMSRKLDEERMNEIIQDFLKSAGPVSSDSMAIIFHMTSQNKSNIEEGALGRNGIRNFQNDRSLVYWVSGNFHYKERANLGDSRPFYWAALWIHELLHSQGIVLHAPGNGLFGGLGQNQGGSSWALDAWETFLLGWTDDSNVYCLPREQVDGQTIFMQPLEIKGDKYGIAIVPINDTEALVVESRRPVGYSEKWNASDKGIFVYRLNTATDTDRIREALSCGNNPDYAEWAYYVAHDGSENLDRKCFSGKYAHYLIKSGQSVSKFGIKISVLESRDFDVIRISKA